MQTISAKSICELYAECEHERVVLWSDPACGYRGIIAIHSIALGPAVGGTRFWNYDCEKVASLDALRLSRAMSYKNALAGLPFGGGKAVIIGDPQNSNRERIFRAHGRFVDSLQGDFITAEDIGTTPADMEIVNKETRHVAGLPAKSGNPSPRTALGVFRAMQACAMHRWGTTDLTGRTVAIQGCGSTGYYLAEHVHASNASLIVTDVDADRAQRVANDFSATAIAADRIFDTNADIFSPCAMGGVLNDETIPRLNVEIVVGTANNQLLDDRHGEMLAERGTLYAPDYVANAGGIINGCRELLNWSEADAMDKIRGLYDRMLALLNLAEHEGIPPFKAADRLACKLIAAAPAKPVTEKFVHKSVPITESNCR